jgi:hypothetical protein
VLRFDWVFMVIAVTEGCGVLRFRAPLLIHHFGAS